MHRAMNDTSRSLLKDALSKDAYAYRKEPFTLKSGRLSNHYVDCRRVLLSPMYLAMAARLVSTRVYEMCKGEIPAGIAGVVVGASALALKTAELLGCEGLWVRPESKDHGTKKLVEYSAEFERLALGNGEHADTPVVVVEDVTTTGQSALDAVKALRGVAFGEWGQLMVLGVVSLVDREEGAAELYAGHGIEFASVFKLDNVKWACFDNCGDPTRHIGE